MAFSTFTLLRNHHHHPSPESFHHLLWKLVNPQSHNTCYYWSGKETKACFLSPHLPSLFLRHTCSLASAHNCPRTGPIRPSALPGVRTSRAASWSCLASALHHWAILFSSPSCTFPPPAISITPSPWGFLSPFGSSDISSSWLRNSSLLPRSLQEQPGSFRFAASGLAGGDPLLSPAECPRGEAGGEGAGACRSVRPRLRGSVHLLMDLSPQELANS